MSTPETVFRYLYQGQDTLMLSSAFQDKETQIMGHIAAKELLVCSDLEYVLEKSKRNEKKEERWSAMPVSNSPRTTDGFNVSYLDPSPSNALKKWKQDFRESSPCGVKN